MHLTSNKLPSVEALTSLFGCPHCKGASLHWSFPVSVRSLPDDGSATCSGCKRSYSLQNGILDFLAGTQQLEVITPFQRLMQFPPVIAIYEKYWRPLGFFVASSSSFRQFSTHLIKRVDPQKRRTILDLACGPGVFACPMAAQTSGWVIGFDLSLPMLQQARKKADLNKLRNILFVRGSALSLPFRNDALDAVLCTGALHLFDRPEAGLAEIARTLSREGHLVCQTTLKPRHWAGLVSFLERVIRFGFFASIEDLNEKLRLAGIQVERQWSRRIIHAFQARRL
ncbi:MAG: class I SAM-dependent methyltransferase [Acidobacteria bacterium]|nr:class I SAM-dependent methyltransferase [Acidobacteriota bacterium]MCI0623006.1 class I SAM-dependent methyltransferase [Acidobacteriota bacterium]MCI0717486.1 class I SAM-dependent methyltransferase [Acidobacteriota bacterium]